MSPVPRSAPPPAWPRLMLALAALSLAACTAVPILPVAPSTPAAAATAAGADADVAPSVEGADADVAIAALAGSPVTSPTLAAETPAAAGPDPIAAIAARLTPGPVHDLNDGQPVLIDPPQQGDRSDLWERVRSGYAIPDLDTDLVRRWETYYAGRPAYVRRMTERGGRYLFHIAEEIDKRGMPAELALLPFIESAFNPQALSRVRAAGMWQFMPATGKHFELRQNLFRDDRRDVLASTRAALDYLQLLHRQFGDWHLALAAYNWGQGNVRQAIRRNAAAHVGTGYTDLRMPDETRNYVPKLQAIKNLIGDPARFGIELPPLENHPFFLSVPIVRDIDVTLAAQLADLPLAEFQALNPQMNKPVILAAGTPHILLPYDNAHHFAQSLSEHRGALASWTAWLAPSTMSPAEAARRVGMTEARLREVNRIPPRMQVRAGSALLVPRAAGHKQDVTEHVANNGALHLARAAPPLRRVVLKAGPNGDSVAAVARRYRVTPALVAQWNKVGTQARFRPGANIVVMLPPRAARATRTAATPPAARPARPAASSRAGAPAPRTAQRHPASR